jgi:hypothetical protein
MATVNQLASLLPTASSSGLGKIEEPIGDSSWIAKIKYDPALFQLTVTTKRGDEYVHFMVYPMTVQQMMQAPSKGRFYATNIKGKGLATKVISKSTGGSSENLARGPKKEHGRKAHGR